MEKDNLRYEAYVRKSTESAERQALSIPAQKKEIKAKFGHLRIVRWVEDSKSAYEAENRPEFDAMMKRLKNGEIDGIIAWKPNRLSRNALEAGLIVHYIDKGFIKNIRFVSYTFENTPEGIKQLQYELADSRCYSANLSVDVRRGNKEKRERGWLPTANLNGYLNMPNPNQTEEDPTESITAIDPERFHLVRQAWDLLLTGQYSVPAILDIMNNQWGYRTRKTRLQGGTPLSRSGLYNIFNNVKYTGKIPNPITGELMGGSYTPMITVEEYNKAQKILGNHGKPCLTEKKEFAYKGIAVCGECGCGITAEHKRNKRYTYYHCTHKRKDYHCKQPSIEESELVRQLEQLFDGLSIRKEFEEWGLEAMQAINGEEADEKQQIIETQTKALKTAEDKANRLLDLVANGTISESQYQVKSVEAEAEIKTLREELDYTLNNGGDWREAMRKTLDVLFNGRKRFEKGDVFVKREVLQSLGSNIVIKDGKLSIDTYEWLEPVKNGYKVLEANFEKVRTAPQQIEKDPYGSIRLDWRRGGDSNP